MTEAMSLVRSTRTFFEQLQAVKNKSPKLTYWKELEQTQFLSRDELLAIQQQRLKKLIEFVWNHNPFYRQRMESVGLTSADFRDVDSLRRLPVLSKADVRQNTTQMLSQGFAVEQLHRAKTGGSTGKALDLYFTEECSELRNACARRHDCWTGWRPGEMIAACWGNPKRPKTLKEKLQNYLLQPYFYLDTMHVDDSAVKRFAESWRKALPTLLYGHAHSLFLLAGSLRRMKIELPPPKGILSTSMMLIPSERKVVEEVFGIPVTDRYGCEEVSLIASECEKHDGLHLNIEHLVVEFLDENDCPVAPGVPGRIVVTDLMNLAMPFIRYQVEDVGVPTDRICSCGRGLPLMEQVTGRVADFLIKPDGSRVGGISLIENTLTRFAGIDQLQIVQEQIAGLDLNLVPGREYSADTEKALHDYFAGLWGANADIRIVLTDAILPEKSGKYRFSICRVET